MFYCDIHGVYRFDLLLIRCTIVDDMLQRERRNPVKIRFAWGLAVSRRTGRRVVEERLSWGNMDVSFGRLFQPAGSERLLHWAGEAVFQNSHPGP